MFRKLDLVEKVTEQYREERDGTELVDTNVSNTVQLLTREILKQLEHESAGVWISFKAMETHQMCDVLLNVLLRVEELEKQVEYK